MERVEATPPPPASGPAVCAGVWNVCACMNESERVHRCAARGRVAESPGEGEGCRGAEGEGGEGACAADGLQWYVLGG